jgi:hypothetical protein
MTLTSAFQLIPEQSTAALIVHHPEAKYYAVRGIASSGATDGELSAISYQLSATPTAESSS